MVKQANLCRECSYMKDLSGRVKNCNNQSDITSQNFFSMQTKLQTKKLVLLRRELLLCCRLKWVLENTLCKQTAIAYNINSCIPNKSRDFPCILTILLGICIFYTVLDHTCHVSLITLRRSLWGLASSSCQRISPLILQEFKILFKLHESVLCWLDYQLISQKISNFLVLNTIMENR